MQIKPLTVNKFRYITTWKQLAEIIYQTYVVKQIMKSTEKVLVNCRFQDQNNQSGVFKNF